MTVSKSRRRNRRISYVAKLPKMNNSERGKYYRKKYRDHELSLEQCVANLHQEVRGMERFLQMRDELAFRNPYDSCESIAGMIFEYFVRDRRAGLRYDSTVATSAVRATTTVAWNFDGSTQTDTVVTPSIPLNLSSVQPMMRYWGNDTIYDYDVPSSFLFFHLLSLHVQGAEDAAVIVMQGLLHTKYTRATIDRMFPQLIHYPELFDIVLDQEAKYPCTYRFYFGSNGQFYNKTVEADYMHGLRQIMGNLEDVVWLLDGSLQ